MLKKFLSAVLSVCIIFSMSACNSPSLDEAEIKDVTLNLWHQWTREEDPMRLAGENYIAQYEAAHENVNIEVHFLEGEAYKTKISTEFAGRAKDIDIFFYWGGGRGEKLARADKLLALNDYLSEDLIGRLKPDSTTNFEWENKLYSLPISNWILVLYCNKDMFDAYGIDLPVTYAQLLNAVKQFRMAGINIPLAQGLKEPWQAAFVYEALAMREIGTKGIAKMYTSKADLDDDGFIRAAQKAKELFDAGAFGDNPTEIAASDADRLFLTGISPMRLQGNWITEQITKDSATKIQDANIVALNFPLTEGGDSDITQYCGGYIDGFFINKNTRYPDVAVDFYIGYLQYLGRAREESGGGFSGFISKDIDHSGLNATALQLVELESVLKSSAIAWDTAFDERRAALHLNAVQTLFTKESDVDDMFYLENEERFGSK